jgi:hypothetical protein
VLAVPSSSTSAGTQLVQTTDTGADNQLWKVVNVG